MFQTLPDFLRLWFHESHRVFADRLVNDEDRSWFSALLSRKMKENFDADLQQVVLQEPLLYVDFLSMSSGENRPYVEVTDISKVIFS